MWDEEDWELYQEILKPVLAEGRFEELFERFVLELKIEWIHIWEVGEEGVF